MYQLAEEWALRKGLLVSEVMRALLRIQEMDEITDVREWLKWLEEQGHE